MDNTEKNKTGPALFWQLFKATFILSACTFGGGYVIVSLMKKDFVENKKWLEMDEMMDLTALAQSCPGALAVNASYILGYHIAGYPGAFVTLLGTVTPPLIILTIVSHFYQLFSQSAFIAAIFSGMQAGIAAIVADVAITMALDIAKSKDWLRILVMALCFALVYFYKLNIGFIIVGCAIIGLFRTVYRARREER